MSPTFAPPFGGYGFSGFPFTAARLATQPARSRAPARTTDPTLLRIGISLPFFLSSDGALELSHQLGERRFLEDARELRTVVVHQADPLDHDVVDPPPVPILEEMVVHRDLLTIRRYDHGTHHRVRRIDRLLPVEDLFPLVRLDLPRVGVLEEFLVQAGELLALRRGAVLPVDPKRPLRHLPEIEMGGHRFPEPGTTLRLHPFSRKLRVLDDGDALFDRLPDLPGRLPGAHGDGHGKERHEYHRGYPHRSQRSRILRFSPRPHCITSRSRERTGRSAPQGPPPPRSPGSCPPEGSAGSTHREKG